MCSTYVGDDLKTPHTVACNPPLPLHIPCACNLIGSLILFLFILWPFLLSPLITFFPGLLSAVQQHYACLMTFDGWPYNITTCCWLTALFLWSCLSVGLWWGDFYFYFQFFSFRCISAHAGCSVWCLDLLCWQHALFYLSPSLWHFLYVSLLTDFLL